MAGDRMEIRPNHRGGVAKHMEMQYLQRPICESTEHATWKILQLEHDFAAQGVDSLAHRWHWQQTIYAYPPTFLLSRVLQKVIHERVYDMILITPLFPLQSWWPLLMETLVEAPIILPSKQWLTTDPAGQYTYRHVWPLIAWRISGDLRYAKKRRHEMRYGRNAIGFRGWIRKSTRRLLSESQQVRNETVLIRSILATQAYRWETLSQ